MLEGEGEGSSMTYKDEDRALIKLSFEEFVKQDYGNALKNLNKLEASIGASPKIAHNKAVVEYYLNDLQKHEQFRKCLQQITGCTQFSAGFEIKDVKMCSAFYNQALLLHHFRQPQQALKIMTAVLNVLNHANHLDENFIQRSYLLTLTMLLETNQPRKAKALLEQLENRLGISREALINDDDEIVAATEELTLTPKEKERNLEDFLEMLKLCTIRVNLANGKTTPLPKEETSEFSIAKAHQYYLGNDFQMAARELSKKFTNDPFTIATNGEDQDTIIANNMGLIHFAVRHYAMAVRFFQHAVNFDKNANEDVAQKYPNGLPLHAVGASKQTQILYNLGVALLHLQRPKEAFECLIVPLNYHHNNPRLWLRIAEACIMLHRQEVKQNENKGLVSSVVSSGVHRKYILQPTPPKTVSDGCLFAIPSPNLEFAVLCLRNAYTLIEHFLAQQKMEEEKQQDTDVNMEWDKKTEGISVHPSKPLKDSAFQQLRSAVLASFSYVLLTLGDYTLSLKYSKELLKIPNLSDTHRLLGHLYCAESLIMLNKVPEAIIFLDPKFLSELHGEDFETRASPDWNVNSLEAAQSIVTYNLAVALVMKGDAPEVAKNFVMSCNHPIVAHHVKMLKLYMELQAGNIENCRKIIRMDAPQYI
ncbi:CCR4-NOT transcription complex subunit 10 [Lutzomyia longipalpis]|uniref:CCR4-NOT transcription complex subunit 10 n=1 Tax=Lutzomyia longipalpis TaxID=7200 RepID=A0A1B0GH98_LUTLO|nr:CCR4-NOT transcription complex subunit 10 [Lutzomyia longipalpis]